MLDDDLRHRAHHLTILANVNDGGRAADGARPSGKSGNASATQRARTR